jgi:predicted PurR-regulated permease PerM
VLLVASLTDSVQSIAALATDLTTLKLPDPPAWVTELPVVGERIDSVWRSAKMDIGATMEQLQPYIITATQWLLAEGAQLGLALLEFLLFIKPYLISRQGAGIPTMLIFIGVLGGLIAWGFLGIFLGATLLAIGYTVLRSWLNQAASAAP